MTEITADQLPAERPMDEYGDPDMMSEQSALMIQQAAEHYENKLRDFVDLQGSMNILPNRIFTIYHAMMVLGLDQDSDAALYAIPSIMKALHKLGCKTEKLIVFIPPRRIPTGEIVD